MTPSYVAFTESERLIGDAAKNQAALNPRNTIFDAKSLPSPLSHQPRIMAFSVFVLTLPVDVLLAVDLMILMSSRIASNGRLLWWTTVTALLS